jgi:hypothetical protein
MLFKIYIFIGFDYKRFKLNDKLKQLSFFFIEIRFCFDSFDVTFQRWRSSVASFPA